MTEYTAPEQHHMVKYHSLYCIRWSV